MGVRVWPAAECLAHLERDARRRVMQGLRQGARLDARGVIVDGGLLDDLFEVLSSCSPDGRLVLDGARFDRTTFKGEALFDEATFRGGTSFWKSTFLGDASFHGSTFEPAKEGGDAANFFKATFHGEAIFDEAMFHGPAIFTGAAFKDETSWASFSKARFAARAAFNGATFHGETPFTEMALTDRESWLELRGATFHRKAVFEGVQVEGIADFTEVTFDGQVSFNGARFGRDVWFHRTTFGSSCTFDRTSFATGSLRLDSATFMESVTLELTVEELSCGATRFLGEATLRVNGKRLWLEGAEFTRPSLLIGASDGTKDAASDGSRTRVLSVRRANVANLVVSNMDLRACRFAGCQNLDGLRIEAGADTGTLFAMPPGWRSTPGGLRLWTWTRRQVLAEEHEWRSRNERGRRRAGWCPQETRLAGDREADRLDPVTIAGIYRSLRKGREDNKDEPGAGDFYYGEMEMRRRVRPIPAGERLVLFCFWLFSGYALRASRAVLALAAAVALFGVAFNLWGFDRPRSLAQAMTYSIGTATDLLGTTSPVGLAAGGVVLYVALRILGPLLLGLAVLSLRGRIKR